ncbi:MAG: ribosome assembly cofactor RimP [Bacteroidales bacterium]|nr:ribosome assembly cofactor RimP [Bacteroidales bacterium]
MVVSEIKDAMNAAVVARGCFIVDVKVSKSNEIEIVVESEEGVVSIEDCVALSRVFESLFDRDVEDYGLTVSSAGLDEGFRVLRQYEKAVGTKVEVSLRGGRRFVGVLKVVDESGFEVEYVSLERVEGRKRKVEVVRCERFGFDEVTCVRPYIEW